jgi:hypothetical protein
MIDQVPLRLQMQTVFVSLLQQVVDMFIVDAVIYLLTFAPGGYETQVAQDP